jgi:hypothetical protein
MTAAYGAVIVAVITAVLTFAFNFYLKRRDEARIGGAAERRLRGELQHAAEVLRASDDVANAAWLEPGIEIASWTTNWDQYAARLQPQTWDRVDRAVTALYYLTLAATQPLEEPEPYPVNRLLRRRAASPPPPPPSPPRRILRSPSPERIAVTLKLVHDAMAEMDRREARWLKMRPWRRIPDRLSQRRGAIWAWRVTGVAALLALGVALWAGGTAVVREADPITTHAVVGELRELNPGADVISCKGAGGSDHWTCSVATRSCQIAATAPTGCATRVATVDVRGDAEADNIFERLIDVQAEGSTESKSYKKVVVGAFAHLRRKDPPANLF